MEGLQSIVTDTLASICAMADKKYKSWREATKRTDELMKPGSFVIFKTDIEVDKLLD